MNVNDLFENLAPKLGNHVNDVNNIMSLMQSFHAAKEDQYQLSFAKRGETGVWMNLGRQLDRMDGVAMKALTQGQHTASLVDTLMDVAIYAIKWLAVINAIRPEDFQKWLQETYCPYMGLDYDDTLIDFHPGGGLNVDALDAFSYAVSNYGVDKAHEGSDTSRLYMWYHRHDPVNREEIMPDAFAGLDELAKHGAIDPE